MLCCAEPSEGKADRQFDEVAADNEPIAIIPQQSAPAENPAVERNDPPEVEQKQVEAPPVDVPPEEVLADEEREGAEKDATVREKTLMSLRPAPGMEKELAEEERKKAPRKKASFCKLFTMVSAVEAIILSFGIFGGVVHGLSQPFLCLLFGDLIDGMGGSAADMMDQMEDLCLQMCYVGLGAIVAASLQGGCFKLFSEMQAVKFRTLYFDAVLHQDVGWYDTMEVAALPADINDDLEKIADAFGDKFGNGVMAVSAFLGGFGFAFGLGWLVALVMCAILPFMGIGAMVMGKAVQEVQLESQSWYAKASAVVEECLYAMRTVVSFGGEKRELEKFKQAVLQTRRGGVKNGFKIGAGMGYTMTVVFLGYALAFYFGMTLRYNDEINPSTGEVWNPGRILSIFFCVFIGSFMVGNIDPTAKAFGAARIAAGRFFEILENKTQIQCRLVDTRKDLKDIQSFEIKDVHFYYPARPDVKVLDGLTLFIKRGQKVAVVGESGSGKSTVMSLLERFYDPSEGQVLVNGEDMRQFKVGALRRCIGYVGQEPVLFATTIRENIMQGASGATKEDFSQACADAQLKFIEDLPQKYDTFVGSGGSQFSGGQKQRIAIARALLKKSSFLFLDEATSALDNTSEKMIQATIDNISSKTKDGLGIVSIAHRLSTVRSSDMIYVLSRGKVVENGTHDELMNMKGTYHALAASQEAANQKGPEEKSEEKASEEEKGFSRSVSPTEDVKTRQEAEQKAEADREKEIAKKYKVPMMRLLGYNKPEWPFFVPAIVGALGDGGAMPAVAVALVGSMDAFFKPKAKMKEELEFLCIIFCIIGASNLVACILEHGCFAILGEAMTQRLRVDILQSIFKQEIGFHDDPENTPGMLAKALELWAYRVSNLCKSIGAKAAAMSSIVVGLTIAISQCWQMALVMLASIPIMVIANAIQMIVLLGASKKENNDLKHAQQIVSDSVQNSRTIQALGNEKALVQMYDSWVKKSLNGIWSRNTLAGLGFGISAGIMFFIMAGGFYYAATLIESGEADFKSVMMAFMGVFYAGMGAGQAAVMVGDATKAKVACHDMFKLLDRQSLINGLEPDGEIPKEIEAGMMEFVDVKFFYPFRPQVQVLKGVSFKIMPGMSVGLVGPSGGGKSTVMAMIQRFYDPQEGGVLIGAAKMPLSKLNIRWWRRQVGFVGQEPVLFNTTVRENIMYGLDDGETISDERLKECEKMANLNFLYTGGNTGLETEVGPRGQRLSGGQKQRVAICRALVRNPAVMLLDEATSALDTNSERIVQKALENARKGRTSFAIAHRLSTIAGSDVIIVVADGCVVEMGKHHELMERQGVYHKLQSQSQH